MEIKGSRLFPSPLLPGRIKVGVFASLHPHPALTPSRGKEKIIGLPVRGKG